MEAETIELIICIVLGISTVVFGILWFYLKYKKLPSTVSELDEALENGSRVSQLLKEIIAFFNPEKPMSDTSLKTIQKYIPSNSYQMTEDSLNRVLSTCRSEEEKNRIIDTVTDYENPNTEGEECVEYTLETSTAIFRVYLGVPELITDKLKATPKLSQMKLSEIISLMDGSEPFSILWQVIDNERRGVHSYYLVGKDKAGNEVTVVVEKGEYMLNTP